MGDYQPVNDDQPFSLTASAAITGGQLVTASGALTAAPSVAGDHSIGVAASDTPSGGRVTIWPLSGRVHEVLIKSGSVIAAGAPIIASSVAGLVDTGTLATTAAAGTFLGICLRGGTGDGTTVKARFMGVA